MTTPIQLNGYTVAGTAVSTPFPQASYQRMTFYDKYFLLFNNAGINTRFNLETETCDILMSGFLGGDFRMGYLPSEGNIYIFNHNNGTPASNYIKVFKPLTTTSTITTYNKPVTFTIGTRAANGIGCVVGNILYYTSKQSTVGGVPIYIETVNLTTFVADERWMFFGNSTVNGSVPADSLMVSPQFAFNAMIEYNGYLYVAYSSGTHIYKININTKQRDIFVNATTGGTDVIYGMAIYKDYLYVSYNTSGKIQRYNLTDPSQNSLFYSSASTPSLSLPYDIRQYNGNLYVLNTNGVNLLKIIIPPEPVLPYSVFIDTSNTYTIASGNLQVSFFDASNSTNAVYYQYSVNEINGGAYSNANAQSISSNSYRFFINGLSNATYTINVVATNTQGRSSANTFTKTVFITPNYAPFIDSANTISSSSGNLTVSFKDTNNWYLNDISYGYYLYDVTSGGTNSFNVPTAYTLSNNKLTNGITQYSIPITGLANKVYAIYLISQNSVGYSANSAPYNISVFTTPSSTVNINNTITVASGNLKVTITDLTNTSINNVYYYYALNYNTDASYANTFVKAGTSPYTFFIPAITDISNTLYVRASNTVGNSSPAANLQVIVYQTPRVPPSVSFNLVGSGNVRVSINESASPPDFYYLNNVSYYLYAYNTFGGTNLSGNTSLLVYNLPVGILSNTNTTYGNVVSYINTGLSANTYTMYVIAKNDIGNSNPVFANISVLTTPSAPSIDVGNTKSITSGNLTITINDTANRNNQVYYLYSLDGINYGNSGVFLGANTRTTFTVSDTGNAQIPLTGNTYTLYIIATNSFGNSTPTTAPVQVYNTPLSQITIDASNTQCITSGNLTVYVNDTVNSLVNGIYYLYSTDGITYGNSGSYKTGNTTIFTISNTGNAQVPLTARTYTLYVTATNPVGNTVSSPATAVESVYVTPFAPTIDIGNTKSITSGNLNVGFSDTFNTGNNQVEYTYFMYDSTGPPLFFV